MRWIDTAAWSTGARVRPTGSVPSVAGLLRWVYFGRVTVAVVVFLAAAFSFRDVPSSTIVIVAVAALASVLMSGWSGWYTHIRNRKPSPAFLYAQAVFDLGLVTTIVHVTEGPLSEFPALYIVVIAVSAVLMPLGASLLITTLASLLYVADIVFLQTIPLSGAVFVQIALFIGVFLSTGLITGRVQAAGAEREELQQEVRRLRLRAGDILRNIRSGVVSVDGAGKLAFANEAARELLDLDESEDRNFAEILDQRSPELWAVIEETQRSGAKSLRSEGFVRSDGRTFPIGVTTTALNVDGEGLNSVTAIFTDISDQKRLEELRLRTERLEAVAELSASLAHEIKNPLASIRSSIEQLSRSERANEDERFLGDLVIRETDRLSRLLSEFLDFSRVRVTNCRPLDLADVVQDAVDVVRQHPECTPDADIELQTHSAALEGDEDLLHRVVVNLVLNAVQAATGTPQVTIEVRQADIEELPRGFLLDGAVILRVHDDGPGIPSELRDRLFEPFVTGREGGSGLGLAIVQRAVQAHRGAVFVDSKPGRGTTLTIFLPAKSMSEVTA